MEDDQKHQMKDNQKIQNGRRSKIFKREDDQRNSKWKTTKKNQNGRQPKKSIWKTTKKIQMEDDKKNQNGRRPKQFRNIQNCLGPLHAPFGVSFIFSSCTLWKEENMKLTENNLDGGRQH